MAHTAGSWVTYYSWPNRLPYRVWEKSVPRIDDQYADCVVYIYRSLADAKAGDRIGGSGFLVQVPLRQNPDFAEAYVVTNRHVVKKAESPVVRLNRHDGTVEYFQTTQEQWIMHPHGDDVALFPFQPISVSDLKMTVINISQFLTPGLLAEQDVGIGDDTFMIGRFINHEGKQQNTPAIRFGNIAMMPKEKIVSEEGLAQESFLVEIRSLPGYSGSPVFIYTLTAMMDFSRRNMSEEEESLRQKEKKRLGRDVIGLDPGPLAYLTPKGPFLLGLDWCHLHTTERIRDKNGELLPEGWTVTTNSGMAGVIPAWKIAEMLNSEELTEMRKNEDDKLTNKKRESAVTFDTAEEQQGPPSLTKEDFEAALKKASRKIEPHSTKKQ
jgi:trypsin-like peptidase